MIHTNVIENTFFKIGLLFLSLLISYQANSQNEYIDIEFIDFQISDTITEGGTLTVTGTLKNNGNIAVEPEVEMLMEVLPMGTGVPTFDSDIENNFNNKTILPNESQPFERRILANGLIGLGGNNVVVIVWPRNGQQDLNFQNNVFEALVHVKAPDPAIQNKKLNCDPVVVQGDQIGESLLIGMPVDEIVGFKYDGNWQQIPIQIDELDIKDILDPYGPYRSYVAPSAGTPSSRSILFYTDENTYTGADTDPNFDLDDELVFMYKDAGVKATETDYPVGVIQQTATELTVTNLSTEKYIYLFQQDGTLEQDAGVQYVDYDFRLAEDEDEYPDDFDFLNDETEEDSRVVTSVYRWKFKETWRSDALKIYGNNLSEDNLLKRHQTHSSDCDVTENDFSEEVKCFIANISGPVRAIRSYMGATDENPYMQRTHFFYEKRQDIYTDIRVQSGINDYFDLFNFDSDIDGMSYINNIDVSAAPIDGRVNDPMSPALYESTPLEWELMDSPHGSILNIHALITNQDSLIPMGYWNDDDDDYSCTSGRVYGNSGLQVQLNDLCTDPFDCPNNYVQHRRCMFFDAPGMPVEEASNTARWIHKPPTVQSADYEPCYESPQISVWLEGALNSTGTQMDTSLNHLQLLPAQSAAQPIVVPKKQPYAVFPWNYLGREADRFIDSTYATSVVDWVLVSFRSNTMPDTEIAKTAALLHSDGHIEFLNECLLDRLDGNSFYIAVEHRNHVGILTPTAVPISNGILQFDFSAKNSYTANNTRFGQKQIVPNVWAMYGGEGIQSLTGNDINGDDKAHWSNNSGFFNAYHQADYNMDGDINGSDKVIWSKNNGMSGALPK